MRRKVELNFNEIIKTLQDSITRAFRSKETLLSDLGGGVYSITFSGKQRTAFEILVDTNADDVEISTSVGPMTFYLRKPKAIDEISHFIDLLANGDLVVVTYKIGGLQIHQRVESRNGEDQFFPQSFLRRFPGVAIVRNKVS